MFQFRRFTSCTYVFSTGYLDMTLGGLPHSDIRGSILICSSPRLFAAYRVLLRLLVPRHPPYALSSLIFEVVFFFLGSLTSKIEFFSYFSSRDHLTLVSWSQKDLFFAAFAADVLFSSFRLIRMSISAHTLDFFVYVQFSRFCFIFRWFGSFENPTV